MYDNIYVCKDSEANAFKLNRFLLQKGRIRFSRFKTINEILIISLCVTQNCNCKILRKSDYNFMKYITQ